MAKTSGEISKNMTKPVKVSFITMAGDQVSFKSRKKVTKPIKVSFLARDKKRVTHPKIMSLWGGN